jgi:hypothetical protein
VSANGVLVFSLLLPRFLQVRSIFRERESRMVRARSMFAGAVVAMVVLGSARVPAQEPFWIQPFLAPPASFDEILISVEFAALQGDGIRLDLFALGPEFLQGPAALTTPSLWSQTLGPLQGQLVSVPIGLEFAPGTFLGLGITPAPGQGLNSHDLCLNEDLGLGCEVDGATLPYVTLRARNPSTGLYTSFGPQQLVAFSTSWEETTTVTPEPGTLLLVASGILGVAAAGRRRFAA